MNCKNCGKVFEKNKDASWQVFCSSTCRNRFFHRKQKTEGYHVKHDLLPPKGAIPIREFYCRQCGRDVMVCEKKDKRTVFCCRACEVKYWKHGYLKDSNRRSSGNNICHAMSLGSLIKREKRMLD